MFLDESGDHRLKKIRSSNSVFVIGGVIVDRAYLRDVIGPEMCEFKQQFLGTESIPLHTVDMGQGVGNYAFLSDPALRARFFSDLNGLLQAWEYTVVACAFKKAEFVAQYKARAVDPYVYGLEILVERFCWELDPYFDNGFICAEKRGGSLDRELMEVWEKIRTRGTDYASASRIDNRIVGFDLRDKQPNLPGLQLADLVVTPVGRHVAQRAPKPDQVQWSVVESKMRRRKGTIMGSGLVIKP